MCSACGKWFDGCVVWKFESHILCLTSSRSLLLRSLSPLLMPRARSCVSSCWRFRMRGCVMCAWTSSYPPCSARVDTTWLATSVQRNWTSAQYVGSLLVTCSLSILRFNGTFYFTSEIEKTKLGLFSFVVKFVCFYFVVCQTAIFYSALWI